MALFGGAGDEPRRRALVRGFGFVVACDRFIIAELALPSAGGQTSVRQPKMLNFVPSAPSSNLCQGGAALKGTSAGGQKVLAARVIGGSA